MTANTCYETRAANYRSKGHDDSKPQLIERLALSEERFAAWRSNQRRQISLENTAAAALNQHLLAISKQSVLDLSRPRGGLFLGLCRVA